MFRTLVNIGIEDEKGEAQGLTCLANNDAEALKRFDKDIARMMETAIRNEKLIREG